MGFPFTGSGGELVNGRSMLDGFNNSSNARASVSLCNDLDKWIIYTVFSLAFFVTEEDGSLSLKSLNL